MLKLLNAFCFRIFVLVCMWWFLKETENRFKESAAKTLWHLWVGGVALASQVYKFFEDPAIFTALYLGVSIIFIWSAAQAAIFICRIFEYIFHGPLDSSGKPLHTPKH